MDGNITVCISLINALYEDPTEVLEHNFLNFSLPVIA